jgi:pimeloyl-ACP methyl ester carboxylesterase
MKPLLLVHGAWHNGAAFDLLVAELADRGVEAHTVELPSVGEETAELGDLYADAAVVRAAAEALGPSVAVLGHSYGGLVMTQALAGLPSVSHLVYLAAFMLDEGESLFEACGSMDPPWWIRLGDGSHLGAATPEEIFYNTCSPEVAARAAETLRTQHTQAFLDPLTVVAWRDTPSTYIICDEDHAIPLFAQEAMAQRATSVVHLASDHSPFLGQPSALAEAIVAALR